MRDVLKHVLLAVAASVLALALAEIAVRALVPIRLVGSSLTVYDSVYGHASKRSAQIRQITPEYTMRAHTNSLGFRGPEPREFPHRSILFLGDSFTFGLGVSDGEEYPALVGKELAERYGIGTIPIVNAGLGNMGQGRWVKFLRQEGEKFDPRVVVLQFLQNDFSDNIRERLFALTETGELKALPVPSLSRGRKFQRMIESVPGLTELYLIGLLRQSYHAWKSRAGGGAPDATQQGQRAVEEAEMLLTYRLTEEALRICREEGWPVIALVVGIEGQRLAGLLDVLEDYQVPGAVIPGKKYRPDLHFRIDGHWNASGHRYAAARVTELLDSEVFSLP